jgi:nicotinate dehydrogenase subunit B
MSASPDQPLSAARRELLKASALAIGFSLAGLPRQLSALSMGPFPGNAPGPSPARNAVDSWIVLHEDDTATLLTGRSELGQGSLTGLLQIAAEELDLTMAQIRSGPVETSIAPESGETDASSSIEVAGALVRQAAAQARQHLLQLASAKLRVPVDQLRVEAGVVSTAGSPGHSVRYGELLKGRRFEIELTGNARIKRPEEYKIVGRSVPRANVLEKVTGAFTYMQSLRVPGMLHGRVVRPPGQGPYGRIAQLLSVDESSIAGIPGVRVVRKNNFVGVVAPKEWDAIRAAQQLQVKWQTAAGLPGSDKVHEALRAAKTQDSVILRQGNVDAAFKTAAHVSSGDFMGPYQAHAPFAPHCAIADVRTDGAMIYCSTQGIYVTRMEVGRVTGLPLDKIRVQHVEGAGTFGPSCFHDVAQAAALLSQSVGRPVRVQFMRWDEFGWDPYGPGHCAQARIAADAQGKLLAYQYDGWQHGWINTEVSEELALGTEAIVPPSGPARVVNNANAGGMYDIPNRLLNNHHVSAKDGFLRGSALRSPIDLAISFASEQLIDELAVKVGMDPVEFRRRNLSNPRWLGVLDAVTEASKWVPRKPTPRSENNGPILKGRGVALGTHFVSHGAAVADVEVHRNTGEVRVTHLYGALDAGLVINPDLVESQIMGMLIQATSRVLKEEVTFTQERVTSLDWNSYPVLRFDEHPNITAIVVQRHEEKSTGAGEETMGAAAAAIANAVFDATGVRFHQFPLRPARVKPALSA